MEQLINMLDGKQYEFMRYGRYYYRYVDYNPAPIQVLRLKRKPVNEGLYYCHYKLGDKTYGATLTDTLSWLPIKTLVRGHYVRYTMVKKYKQLSIFDL